MLKAGFATAVNVRELGQTIGNIAGDRDHIIAAMEMLAAGI
ncbi:MAG: hypothetical protein V2I51_15930 [Anderseniella sp.]|nr:hypothetical protein [Anderseniella sp.]